MTPALATSTGTVHEAMVYSPSNVTYTRYEPEGSVVFIAPHEVDEERSALAAVRANLSRLWSAEWDSAEDSVYDTW